MVRILLVLLLLVAGSLALALLRERSGRRRRQAASLRSAFLHGAPLAAAVHASGPQELVAAHGQLRMRLPGNWVQDPAGAAGLSFRDRLGEGRTLRLELETTSAAERVDQRELLRQFGSAVPEKERSVETLPNGNVLLKWLEVGQDAAGVWAIYCWRLGRPLAAHDVRSAVLRFAVPLERAQEVVVGADLAALEREIRSAELE